MRWIAIYSVAGLLAGLSVQAEEPADIAKNLIIGPVIEITAPGEATIRWQSRIPATTFMELTPEGGALKKVPTTSSGTRHFTNLKELELTTKYEFQIVGESSDGRKFVTSLYKFDPTLDYLPIESPDIKKLFSEDPDTEKNRYTKVVQEMLKAAGTNRGFVLVLGTGSGRLIAELIRQSDLQVVVVEEDADRVQKIRRLFDDAGVYGSRMTIHHQVGLELPFGPYFANLITSEAALENQTLPNWSSELFRVLRPAGGTVYLGHFQAGQNEEEQTKTRSDLAKWSKHLPAEEGEHKLVESNGMYSVYQRGKLPESGEWTHQYGRADNSSCSKDERLGGEMSVLWWGRPGSRPMPDRGGRNPAPVSANGRMYVQGDRILFGVDSYNGTILWTRQLPTMRRANMPRDGSNMVATDEQLYLAVGEDCLVFNGQSGELSAVFQAIRGGEDNVYNWGYLSVSHDLLLGSSTKRGSQYQGDQGEWFEDFETASVSRVTSDNFYARDRLTGKTKWEYQDGVIMNSTITLDKNTVYFVESRNPKAIDSLQSRLLDPVQQNQYLVALDLTSGEIRWEKPYDFSKCEYMTYLSYTNDTLLVTGSDRAKKFHTFAFDARNGYELWTHSEKAHKKHHSGHLSHPVLIGDKLYHNKQTLDLRTGNVLETDEFDWHGCGVMTASNNMLFRRFEYHGMLDLKTKKRTEFMGVRSGCWLSLIPSGGVLLAPETGSGCFCAHALQTSIAFYPKKDEAPKEKAGK